MNYAERYHQLANNLLHRLNERDLVFEFFVVFSRFEYALMRSGFIKGDQNHAFCNWDRFASEARDNFDPSSTPELQEAVDYFLNIPPKKQVVENGGLAWVVGSRPENEPLLLTLTVLLRQVRNNLFHGDKLSDLLEKYSPRNRKLLRFGLLILYAFLELSPEVRKFLGELKWEL